MRPPRMGVILVGTTLVAAAACVTTFAPPHHRSKPASHRISAIAIDSECQVVKEQEVHVKTRGHVDWYVLNGCDAYAGQTVSLEFLDGDGSNAHEIDPPTANGKCNKCAEDIDNGGLAKLSLDAKASDQTPFVCYYKIWIGTASNPRQTELADPKFEIDP